MKHQFIKTDCIMYYCQMSRTNIDLIELHQTKNPRVADIIVFEDGDIYTIHDATPNSPYSRPFFRYEETTGAKTLFIITDGVSSWISFYQIYKMAFEEDEMPEKALKQKVAYELLIEKIKKGEKISYRKSQGSAW